MPIVQEVEDDTRALRNHLEIARLHRTAEEDEAARREAARQEERFGEFLHRVYSS